MEPEDNLKIKSWKYIIENAENKPNDNAIARNNLIKYIMIPLISGLIVGIALVVISPPFVCKQKASKLEASRISMIKILAWIILTASICAIHPLIKRM